MNVTLDYDFLAPQKIVFGWGRRREIGSLARSLGRRAFLVSGLPEHLGKPIIAEIEGLLRAEAIEVAPIATLSHEPEVADVDCAAVQLRALGAGEGDFLLALGGGAAIDLAKAAAAMATNDQSPTIKDYLENVGRDLKIVCDPLPVLAVPTTAGTGAEATKNAVISAYDPPFKKSVRDDRLMPRIALIDPELTVSVPPEVTAAGGMDAITQLIESFLSRKAKPIPQALAVQGLKLAMPSLGKAVENPSSRLARGAMSHAALLSGMALTNSGLGMAHGVAAALGIHCRVPHGVACALMLPVALEANREICQFEIAKLCHVIFGRKVPARAGEAVDFFIEKIESLCCRVKTPRRLSQIGVRREQIPDLVKSSRGSSMNGNPRELSDQELTDILEGIF
ncbi:MAG: iron-containing alcohol dehydrogenase [Pirellulales bacterium]|nr:iron-containing alcohol dehydrogenase [Pirellulales bacterium]